MDHALTPSLDALTKRYQLFREDPIEALRVKIRQIRAEQIRELLTQPTPISLNTFNKEIWAMQSSTVLHGQPIPNFYDRLPTLSPEVRQQISEALDLWVPWMEPGSNILELHGNYVWKPGSTIYGPNIHNEAEREENVQLAMMELTDDHLTPDQKVAAIRQISGFGNGIATGLVMLFHPDKYAVFNSQSAEAVGKYGYDVSSLGAFTEAIDDLKGRLGAADFLELDWFLYQENNREEEPSSDLVPNDFIPASVVPQHDILEEEGLELQHKEFRVLTKSLMAGVKRDIEAGARIGCLVSVGVYVRPAEILGDELRFDPSVNSECYYIKMRRSNGENVEHKITRRTIWIMEAYAQQLEEQKDVFLDVAPTPQARPLLLTAAPTVATNPTELTPRMVKVAPGVGANFWQECLHGGYICVGWDDLKDLNDYRAEAEFRESFERAYPYRNKQGRPSRSKMSAKANELWKFRNLQPGDLVAANEGASKILGIGTVLAPGYEYRPDRSAFHHTVRVRWDTSLACAVPKQGDWPLKTVSEIRPALAQFILTHEPLSSLPNPSPVPNQVPVPGPTPLPVVSIPDYIEPSFSQIETAIAVSGLRLDAGLLRRYHLALKTRGFVILSGISGTGKTWLAEEYAQSVGAQYTLVPVAPNWTTNEDLLGYLNPISGRYHDTDFSSFLRRVSEEYHRAENAGKTPHPYHVILDEMNLARVEFYFAKFLSLMEQRARHGQAPLDLGDTRLTLPPNLKFIGTINVDETTHGFADKVYDRAQLLELTAPRQALSDHIGDERHREVLLEVWDAVAPVAPFAFRVIDEIRTYVAEAAALGISWQEALDEQMLQKVLPKLKGTDLRLGLALQHLTALPTADFPRTVAKATVMHQGFTHHGFASFF